MKVPSHGHYFDAIIIMLVMMMVIAVVVMVRVVMVRVVMVMMMVMMMVVMVVLFMGVKDMRGCQIWTMMSMTMPILLVCHLHKGKYQTMNNPIILIPRSRVHLFFICPLISQSE